MADALDNLKRLAQAAHKAKPGPWQVDGPYWIRGGDIAPECVSLVSSGEDRAPVALDVPEYPSQTTLAFIAAANPEAILALLAEFEQRERKLERLIVVGKVVAASAAASWEGDPYYSGEVGIDAEGAISDWNEAVADLQAEEPPPVARDPIPDTGGKIKW